MRINSIIGLAVVGMMLYSCQSDSYQIKGYTHHLNDGDTIWLAVDDTLQNDLGHAIVHEGHFSIAGTTDTTLLVKLYTKNRPASRLSFFLEPGTIVIEFNRQMELSRVSGTTLNNNWQELNDSIRMLGHQLIRFANLPNASSAPNHETRLRSIDSLHRRMNACILQTAQRNKDNPLGRYISENYKEPEFK